MTFRSFAGLILALLTLPARGQSGQAAGVENLPPYQPAAAISGRIVVWGHGSAKRDFMGSLLAKWFEAFGRFQPGVVFENRMYGTASAVGALSVGAGNLAVLGEEINPDAAREFERARGYPPTAFPIATGSLDVAYFDYAHMIFVHRDNPLRQLSLAQLEAVFGAEHRRGDRNARVWGDLGLTGAWARRPIHPYCWQVDEDFALFFRERVLGGSHRWNPAVREYQTIVRADGTSYEHAQQILEALARDPDGIAVSTVRFARPEVKLLPLAERPDGEPVLPTPATLVAQTYPLTRIIPAVVDLPPGQRLDPAVREFLRYILSRDGQRALLQNSGYLPLSAAAVARELESLR